VNICCVNVLLSSELTLLNTEAHRGDIRNWSYYQVVGGDNIRDLRQSYDGAPSEVGVLCFMVYNVKLPRPN